MTKHELLQIFYLKKELNQWKDLLEKVVYESDVLPQEMNGMPFGTGVSDRTSHKALMLLNIEQVIDGISAQITIQTEKIMSYIVNVDDSFMRQILLCRHLKLMSWVQVAEELGGNNTADGVRMAHKRFLENI